MYTYTSHVTPRLDWVWSGAGRQRGWRRRKTSGNLQYIHMCSRMIVLVIWSIMLLPHTCAQVCMYILVYTHTAVNKDSLYEHSTGLSTTAGEALASVVSLTQLHTIYYIIYVYILYHYL